MQQFDHLLIFIKNLAVLRTLASPSGMRKFTHDTLLQELLFFLTIDCKSQKYDILCSDRACHSLICSSYLKLCANYILKSFVKVSKPLLKGIINFELCLR